MPQERIVEQTVAFPVLPLKEKIVEDAEEVVELVTQERLQQRTVEDAQYLKFRKRLSRKRPSRWMAWLHMNECNNGLSRCQCQRF